MKLKDLKDGQVVNVRTASPGKALGKWKRRTLIVEKDADGQLQTLTLAPIDSWAEYGPSCLQPDSEGPILAVDDYLLQIEGLEL